MSQEVYRNLKIAGLTVGVSQRYGLEGWVCKDHETEAAPDFVVQASDQEIACEMEQHGYQSEAQAEMNLLYRKICFAMLPYDGFLLHAAVVALDGKAYAFTAPSGTGKSTHARYWLKAFDGRNCPESQSRLSETTANRVPEDFGLLHAVPKEMESEFSDSLGRQKSAGTAEPDRGRGEKNIFGKACDFSENFGGNGKRKECENTAVRGGRAYILNGDKPILRLMDGRFFACGTPWRGKERLGVAENLPLKAICLLERGLENEIMAATPDEVVGKVFRQILMPQEAEQVERQLYLIDRLAEQVPVYRLKCNMSVDAARIAYEGMKS